MTTIRPTIYLAGGMEKAGDRGWRWRRDITPHLENLGYRVWDPYIEEANVGTSVERIRELKETDYKQYLHFCSKIVDYDLDALVNKCSAVAVLIDNSVLEGAGTYGELTICRFYKIPVFAWIDLPNGEYDVPSWAMGCIDKYSLNVKDFYDSIPLASHKK